MKALIILDRCFYVICHYIRHFGVSLIRRILIIAMAFSIIILTGCLGLNRQVRLNIDVQGDGSVVPASGLQYQKGTLVQLRPVPSAGWAFDYWDGTHGRLVFSNQILMDSNKSIKAVFKQLKYPLRVICSGDGTVEKTIKPAIKTAGLNYGDVVELRAVPDNSSIFDHWEGDLSGKTNPQEIVIDSEKTVTAVFKSKLPSWGGITLSPSLTVSDIFRWSDVTSLVPPKRFKVWLSRFGTERSEYQVEFVGTQEGTAADAGYRMIVCKGLGDFQIGHGDSGSPILTSDNLVVGAVSKIFQEGDTINFKCTSIEDMLAIGKSGLYPRNLRSISQTQNNRSIYISGAASSAVSRISKMNIWKGQEVTYVDSTAVNRIARTLDNPQKPLPGQTICISYLSGPINIFTSGTLTYEPSPGVYLALGHPDARTGDRSLPVRMGYVFNMSAPPGQPAVKQCIPIGAPIGTLTRDEDYGVMIEKEVEPVTTPIKLLVKLGEDSKIEYEFELAKDNGSDIEYNSLLSALILQLEVHLRYTSGGNAVGSLLLQKEGDESEIFDIDASSETDILYAPGGIADQITTYVDQIREIGTPFEKATLDIEIIAK